MHAPPNLTPGEVFADEFRIVRPLGSGGMGQLYVVTQLSTNKHRALKLLVPALVAHDDARARFLQEARAAAAIDSEHVVDIVTAGVDSMTDAPYIVMELLDGQDLGELVEGGGPVPFEDVRLILTHIGHALRRAHAQGIVHRDIKPENVFLAHPRRADERFTAKVLDFGVAKILSEKRTSRETQPVGSPLFMAPEQTDPGGRIGPPSDVWALGLLAFYLLTGAYYWRSATQSLAVPMMLKEVCFDTLDPASARAAELGAPELPLGFDAWFAGCVTRDIDARFPDGGAAVEAFLSQVEMLPPPEPLDLFPDPPLAPPSPLAITGDDPVLALSRRKPSTSTPQTFSAPPAAPAPKASRARDLLPIVVIAGGIAVGLSSGLALGMRAQPSETHAEPAAAPAGAEASATAPSSVRSSRPLAPVAASAGAASFCPRGMVASGDPPICIGRTEVTVADYARCVEDGACAPLGRTAAEARRPEVQKARDTLCNGRGSLRDHPANCVTYRSAQNYCAFANARLPTETEWTRAWQAAKRPPGAQPGENLCRWECAVWWHDHGLFAPKPLDGDDGYEATSPVAAFTRKELAGAPLDLEGNVAEWVDSDPTLGAVALGSSFASAALPGDVAEKLIVDGGAGSEAIGFRCVSDP